MLESSRFTSLAQFVKTYPLPVILALFTIYLLRNKYGAGLNHIPGPSLAGWTKLWRLNDVRKGQAHMTAIKLHKKYGKLVRTAPNVVDVSDASMIPVIYNIKGDFAKTGFYPIQSISWQKKPQMNLFSTRDEEYHKEQNKLVANAFSMTTLLDLEPAVDSCSMLFMQRLGSYADSGQHVDLGSWLQYYAFDVVGEISFGIKFGFLEKGGDVDGMIALLDGMLLYASICGQIPEAHPFLLGNPLFPILFPQMESWNEVVNFTLKAVNSRSSLKRDGDLKVDEDTQIGSDMLSRWTAVNNTDPLKMSTRDVIVHLSANVFAGSGTTAITLRAVIYYLCKNPSKMKKAVDELDSNQHHLSNPITYKEATNHLPYMNAVLKEAMRIHPSTGLLLERHVPVGGATICSEHIPGGTIVGINAWVLHYDEKVFPEPEKFIPERWLDSDKKKLAEMEKSFFAFGAGSRTCIGKNISLMEMTKIIPQILREYEFRLAHPEKEWKTKNRWFVQQSGLDCVLKKRGRR